MHSNKIASVSQRTLHTEDTKSVLTSHRYLARDRFICPEDMSYEEALKKSRKASAASSLMRLVKQHPILQQSTESLEKLDNDDLTELRRNAGLKHLPLEWTLVTGNMRKGIQDAATYCMPKTFKATFKANYSVAETAAAKRLLERHQALDAVTPYFKELGFKEAISWASLSQADQATTRELADSDWMHVGEVNLFRNEAEAMKDFERKERRADARGSRSSAWSSKGTISRTKRRAETAKMISVDA
ncbi:hypothetical protein BC830DRAFT_1083961 [Chytriomyces sp. MP71]|nr:hypothetical protein BC830DRAFT_1083961 [Chytriomyces sp. MP71]